MQGILHEKIIASEDKKYTEPLEASTLKEVLKHLKNKNMFRHINKAG